MHVMSSVMVTLTQDLTLKLFSLVVLNLTSIIPLPSVQNQNNIKSPIWLPSSHRSEKPPPSSVPNISFSSADLVLSKPMKNSKPWNRLKSKGRIDFIILWKCNGHAYLPSMTCPFRQRENFSGPPSTKIKFQTKKLFYSKHKKNISFLPRGFLYFWNLFHV